MEIPLRRLRVALLVLVSACAQAPEIRTPSPSEAAAWDAVLADRAQPKGHPVFLEAGLLPAAWLRQAVARHGFAGICGRVRYRCREVPSAWHVRLSPPVQGAGDTLLVEVTTRFVAKPWPPRTPAALAREREAGIWRDTATSFQAGGAMGGVTRYWLRPDAGGWRIVQRVPVLSMN